MSTRRVKTPRPDDTPIDGKCNARLKTTEGLCRHRAGQGTDHLGYGSCGLHGGHVPNAGTHAQRLADAEAASLIGTEITQRERFGLIALRDIDHIETVQDELSRCAGMIALCERRLDELDPDKLVWGEVSRTVKRSVDGMEVTVKHAAELNGWLDLWHKERGFAMRAAETAHRIGLEERQMELAKLMGEELSDVLHAFAADMGVEHNPRLAMAFRRALAPRSIGSAS